MTNEILRNHLIGYSSFKRRNLRVLQCCISFHSFQACIVVISTQPSLTSVPYAHPIPALWKQSRPPTPDFAETELTSSQRNLGHHCLQAPRRLLDVWPLCRPLGV